MTGIELFKNTTVQPHGKDTVTLQVPVAAADVAHLAQGIAKIIANDGLGNDPDLLLAVHLLTQMRHALYEQAMRAGEKSAL